MMESYTPVSFNWNTRNPIADHLIMPWNFFRNPQRSRTNWADSDIVRAAVPRSLRNSSGELVD